MAAEAETSDGLLQLPDAIGLVRQQLVAAQLEGRRVVAGKVATFAVGKVTLELTGEVKKTIGGSGEAKFWALTANAEAERTSGSVHTITVESRWKRWRPDRTWRPSCPRPPPSRPARAAVRSGAGGRDPAAGGSELRPDRERAVRHAQHGRFHLSNVYAKTSTSSRQELAQLLRPSRRTAS